MAGRRIVDMVHEDQKLSTILTREAFENAIVTLAAIGGSTNAVIHLIAIAGRIGVELGIDDFDRLGERAAVPGQPAAVGQAPDGGLLLRRRPAGGDEGDRARCCTSTRSPPTARPIGENIADARELQHRRHQAVRRAVQGQGRHRRAARQPRAARRDHQAERGDAGADDAPRPRRRVRGRSTTSTRASTTRASTSTRPACMVLKNCGPKGYPGMAEVGNMPLPPKVLRKGITDMVRISDARMSGTAYGTVVLHTAPEAAAGGPLAAVRNGDIIELDVPNRRLHLDISDAELAERMTGWQRAGAAARERLLEALRRPRAAGRRGRRPRLPGRQARRVRAARQPLTGVAPPSRGWLGVYLGVVQFFFAACWIVYVIYLPQLVEQAGMPKAAAAWILMADQLVFVFADYAAGVAADRVARVVGRIGLWVLAATIVSCARFPVAAVDRAGCARAGSSSRLIMVWAVTSSALRAPPLALLGKHVAKPSRPILVALSLLGLGVANAIAPYLGLHLRGVDPRIPFALAERRPRARHAAAWSRSSARWRARPMRGQVPARSSRRRRPRASARDRRPFVLRRRAARRARVPGPRLHRQRAALPRARAGGVAAAADAGVLDRLQRRHAAALARRATLAVGARDGRRGGRRRGRVGAGDARADALLAGRCAARRRRRLVGT